jgi:nucleoside phosphorylase
MPYFDAPPAAVAQMPGIARSDWPDAAILVGEFSQTDCFARVQAFYPNARLIEERTLLVEVDGQQIWISVVVGAALAATLAHLAVKLGARALLSVGAMGGLSPEGRPGDLLVPSLVVGRDGVSAQVARRKPIIPDPTLMAKFRAQLARVSGEAAVRSGKLLTTTTISFERDRDLRRWLTQGYEGVEMECAAVVATAAYFGVPAAGGFVLMDHLAVGQTVLSLSEADIPRIRTGKDLLLQTAVAVLVDFVKTPNL